MRVVSSLRRAFTLHYIVAAVFPILLFAWFSFVYFNHHLLNEIFRSNAFLAHEIVAQTEDFLTRRSTILKHLVLIVSGGRYGVFNEADFYLAAEVNSSDDFESIYILDRSGKIIHLGLAAGEQALKSDYQQADFSGHELFKRFARGEEPGWSGVYTSLTSGEPSISLGLTYDDYLVIGNLSLHHLGKIVGRFSLFDQPLLSDNGKSSFIFSIVDRNGLPIAHTDAAMVFRQQAMRNHSEIVDALSGTVVTAVNSHEGRNWVESGLPVRETGWAVWISRDFDQLTAPIRTTRYVFLSILAASVTFATLAGLLVSRKVLRPLGRLVEGVGALADGERVFQLGEPSYVEIDELTCGFKRMSLAVLERELSLGKSESRFRSLVNSIEGIVFEADFPEMRLTFVSERSEQISGYPASTWLATPEFWQTCIHPDDRSWAFNYSLNQVESGRNHQFEYRLLHRDGHVVWVRQMVNLVVEEGAPTRLLGVMIDVTESKEAAIALQESEQRFRSLVEQAADAIYIFDTNGQLVDVNEQACRSLGYSRDVLKTKKVSDIQLLHPSLEFTSLQKTVMQGGPLTFEAEHRRKNSQLVPVEIRLGSFQFQDTPLFLALARDITERKKSDAALKESEERVRLLLDSTAEGVYGMDCAARCTFCNAAGLKLLGFNSEQELLGKNVHELFHKGYDNGTPCIQEECTICNILTTGIDAHSDAELFSDADGRYFPVEYFARPIVKGDKMVGVVVVFHDVTERKLRLQQSIRTAQLASLGELAAGVAHEINNPISGVINYTQILLNRHKEIGEEYDLLQRILKEGERVATIVRDLLFFSREGGPEKVLSSISDLLEDSLSLSAAQIRKEGILLTVDCAKELPLIYARAQQLQQLFLNILSNARHALAEKYPGNDENKKIEISLKLVTHGETGYIRVLFKDYGVGIPKARIERVLHPFVTTKAAGVGTGLGLSISLDIVKKHGGALWIESVEGVSTEVYIELPIARKD
ncbi:MAG: PAS domain S-box protein [Desulfuromonadales bacterium]|nr:PAS domain S-box protein [Desulfuromonadales bacterium]